MNGSKPDPDLGKAAAYLVAVGVRLQNLLGARLIGAYAGGSYALGDFRPGSSDLDIGVVVDGAISGDLKQRLVARLRNEALPCPARGLELVVYALRTARSPGVEPEFELNLNSGPRMELRVDLGPGSGPGHWFPIDRSILAQAGVPIVGPPAAEVFAAIEPLQLLPVLVESIAWHRDNEPPADAVLNACRALRFAVEGRWSSKRAAGRWAIESGAAPSRAVRAALGGKGEPDREVVEELLDAVEAKLRRLERPAGIRP